MCNKINSIFSPINNVTITSQTHFFISLYFYILLHLCLNINNLILTMIGTLTSYASGSAFHCFNLAIVSLLYLNCKFELSC